MQLTELTVLLACHSLEDFPSYHEGREADELLAAWTAPWHPALVAAAGRIPSFHRVDSPPESLLGRLMTVPPFMADRLPAGFAARVAEEGGHLVQEASCDAAVSAALAALDAVEPRVEQQLVDDFLALGFCRLQVELLTRQMRYSTSIDETHFERQVVGAAKSAVAGDPETARSQLIEAFDTLYEARKHYYPVDAYLVDVTLLAPTTLGAALSLELTRPTPINLAAPVSVFERLSSDAPAVWSQLLGAIDSGTACVLGDEVEETELPLAPLETALAQVAAGARRYEALLGRLPQVFARRRAGLWPALPQILVKLGYRGALHCTLDDGRFPLGPQSKTRWEGLDSSVIDVFARVPCDATRAESFLGFSRRMADAMDGDHVATLAFAHWPGVVSPWFDVLRRIAELSPVLGKFMLLDDYFHHTDMPGRLSKFEPDEYRCPYLIQAVAAAQRDPLSCGARRHARQVDEASSAAISTMADLVAGAKLAPASDAPGESLLHATTRLASTLPPSATNSTAYAVVVNPHSFSRRIGVELNDWQHPPEVAGPVIASGSAGPRRFAVVEVPGMGFASISQPAGAPNPGRAPAIGRDNVLANEFFELTISRATGGIQSLRSFRQRGNLLSQQLGFRLPDATQQGWTSAAEEGRYSTMRAESVELTVSCAAYGELVSRGTLVGDEGQTLARFRQTTGVWAGSRIVRCTFEFDEIEEPLADPWGSYHAARFAWPAVSAELYRGVGLARQKTQAAHLEAPEYLEIETATGSISILTGGLAHHRRAGERMIDSLLIVRGETERRFTMGIGVEVAQPASAAVEILTPAAVSLAAGPPPAAASGWFFHLDARNVLATHWDALVDGTSEESPAADRASRGFRARFLETTGRAGRAALRTFRPVKSARQVDFLGQTMLELRVEGDRIMLDFAAFEWIDVEVEWIA
jgi:alpha-mannosidase